MEQDRERDARDVHGRLRRREVLQLGVGRAHVINRGRERYDTREVSDGEHNESDAGMGRAREVSMQGRVAASAVR